MRKGFPSGLGGNPGSGKLESLQSLGGKGPRLDTPSSSRSSANTGEGDGATHEPQAPNRPTTATFLQGPEATGRRTSARGSAGAARRQEGEGQTAASPRVHMWQGRRGVGTGSRGGGFTSQRSSRMVAASRR